MSNPQPSSNLYNNEPMHPALVLIILLASIFFFLMIGSGITLWLVSSKGLALDELMNFLNDDSSAGDRNFFRTTLLVQHLTMFVLPALTTGFIVYKLGWMQGLSLDKTPLLRNIGMGALMIFAAFPLVQFTFWLNKQLPLPEWALDMENSTQELIMQMLKTDTSLELFYNILIIAIIPAIGEELIFRGFIQKSISKITQNPHVAVWVAAIIFSGFHLQFEGFIPRMLLGGLLGYLLVWTNNLWVPIIAHFTNNAFQVVAQYLYSEEMSSIDLEQMDQVNYPLTAISVVAVGYIGYWFWKQRDLEQI